MSQNHSKSRDHSPKRSNSSSSYEPEDPIKGPKFTALELKIHKWFRYYPEHTDTRVDGVPLDWAEFSKGAEEYIIANLPDRDWYHLPYHGVVLYLLDLCYLQGQYSCHRQLAVLLTRITDPSPLCKTKAESFCNKVQAQIGPLGLDTSPFWSQLNEHLYRGTGWATSLRSYSIKTRGNFHLNDATYFTKFNEACCSNRPICPPTVDAPINPRWASHLSQARQNAIRNRKAEEKLHQHLDKLQHEDLHLAGFIHKFLDVHERRRQHADIMIQQINDFILPRLSMILPYYEVALPTFNGRSSLFDALAGLDESEMGDVKLRLDDTSIQFGLKNPDN